MLIASRNQVVSSSSLKFAEHNSVLSFFAYGVKLELRIPDALLSQLAWPIVPGAEFADEGQPDAVLTVKGSQSGEGETRYEIVENGAVLGTVRSLEAAAVWENSDGSKTVDELMQVVEAKSGAPADRKLVLQALEELEEGGLMEAGSVMVSEAGLPSRREAVGKMVMAGSALVATIVAAAPKAHASQDPPKGGDPPPVPTPHNPPSWPLPPIGNKPPTGGHKKH